MANTWPVPESFIESHLDDLNDICYDPDGTQDLDYVEGEN